MVIIDFEKNGNFVRFYLGEKTKDWGWTNPNYKDYSGNTPSWLRKSETYGGDDWDDTPYECNAGTVYEEYIKGYVDVYFPNTSVVLEPCDGEYNSRFCKDDMKNRKVPCIIVVPKNIYDENYTSDRFGDYVGTDGIKKYYFGDEITVQKAIVEDRFQPFTLEGEVIVDSFRD